MKYSIAATLAATTLAMIILNGCSPAQKQEHWNNVKEDFRTLPGDLVQDSKDLVSDKLNVGILLVGGGASGYVRCAHDDRIAEHFEHHHIFDRDMAIGLSVSGNPVTHFAAAGTGYIYGLLAEDDKSRTVSRAMLEALSLTGIMTMGLKVAAQDDGPNGEALAWPSGHTSSSVTVATVLNEFYGPWVGMPMFGLSGLVMYERMEDGEHWASDIVFGAAIGYTVGKTVAGNRKAEIFGMRVLPYINPESGSSGIMLAKQF
jgi:hypothetical protein